MDTKWLEDFVSLAETRSFSRSAQLRHVTQPAFSRRIQSLEAWAGTDLVDRSSYPTRLTPAGQTLYEQALEWLHTLQSMRNTLRQHSAAAQDTIEFAVPHTLAFTFFPAWLSALLGTVGVVKSRLIALNVHDAVLRLVEGSCDLLLAYHHPSQPIQLDPERYEMLPLGQERLLPFAKPDAHGQPLYRLPGTPEQPVPLLAYAPGAYLGRVVDWVLRQPGEAVHVEPVYETDMSESLKAMAIEGHGLAFLPASAVQQALGDGRLVVAAADPAAWQGTLDIRLYRAAGGKGKRAALQFWDDLQQRPAPHRDETIDP
jgi:LysR family transcriptional regulator, hypochlorite-specific transcription factor HypT